MSPGHVLLLISLEFRESWSVSTSLGHSRQLTLPGAMGGGGWVGEGQEDREIASLFPCSPDHTMLGGAIIAKCVQCRLNQRGGEPGPRGGGAEGGLGLRSHVTSSSPHTASFLVPPGIWWG